MTAIRLPKPSDFQRAMIFVDGTNLLYRLRGARLRVPSFTRLLVGISRGQLIRSYIYTTIPHRDAALQTHGPNCFDGLRVVLGTAVPLADGNYKEKGVDALLVADLIYHAAVRNCDNIAVDSTDADFGHALERVEDFGCSTAVLAICGEAPASLRDGCDRYHTLSREQLLERSVAEDMSHRHVQRADREQAAI